MAGQAKTRVIFVCTGNTGRSRMAEALLCHHHGERYEVFSAGTDPGIPDRLVLQALSKLGIDVTGARSKGLDEFRESEFDIAVTLCDGARAFCPVVPGVKTTIHRAFPDPADFVGNEEERSTQIRGLIEQIRAWLEETFGAGPPSTDPSGQRISKPKTIQFRVLLVDFPIWNTSIYGKKSNCQILVLPVI